MSVAGDFLLSFSRALSTMALYGEQHPTRQAAVTQAFERLQRLLEADPRAQFSFLVHEVVYGRRSMREMQDWDWARRLADAGIQRLEFEPGVTIDDFVGFLADAELRLSGPAGAASAAARTARPSHIRYGTVGLPGEVRETVEKEEVQTAALAYTLREEAAAVEYIHDEVTSHGNLALLEAETVVRSLTVAVHGSGSVMIPLLKLKRFDQYTTTHALNVSVLAMVLAETLGFGARDVRAFGTAGLLHDLGKVRVPKDILVKPGKLTESEKAVLDRHPADGARIIIEESKDHLGLASAVAYEHHIMIDGGGYPQMHYRRDCHFASRLVHVCDVFDALATRRPYRDAWEIDRVLRYIEERVGLEFDTEIAQAFVGMMRRFERQVETLEDEEAPEPDLKEDAAAEGAPAEAGAPGSRPDAAEAGSPAVPGGDAAS